MTEPNTDEENTNEAEVLYPDRTVTIQGEAVTVREFRALEGIKLAPKVRPIVTALRQAGEAPAADGFGGDLLERLVSEHSDELLDLMAAASDRPREWVEQLPDSDFFDLLYAFWGCNSGFFMRRLVSALTPAKTVAVPTADDSAASA